MLSAGIEMALTFKFMFPACISSLVFGRSMLLTASLICDRGPPDSSKGYWPLTIPENKIKSLRDSSRYKKSKLSCFSGGTGDLSGEQLTAVSHENRA